jgi:hypothetical protein
MSTRMTRACQWLLTLTHTTIARKHACALDYWLLDVFCYRYASLPIFI